MDEVQIYGHINHTYYYFFFYNFISFLVNRWSLTLSSSFISSIFFKKPFSLYSVDQKKFMNWSKGKVFEKSKNIFWWSLSPCIFTSCQEVKAKLHRKKLEGSKNPKKACSRKVSLSKKLHIFLFYSSKLSFYIKTKWL